jgi:hypothetical protein
MRQRRDGPGALLLSGFATTCLRAATATSINPTSRRACEHVLGLSGPDAANAPVVESARRVHFAVSARVRWWRAGAPWGGLTATADRIVISAVFGKAVLEREHVTSVYRQRFLARRVIAFRTDDGSADWVRVWPVPFRGERIMSALQDLGWPIADDA